VSGGFKASEAVEALDFDFSGISLADENAAQILENAKGTVPEPTQRQLTHFFHRLTELAASADVPDIPDDPSPQQVLAVLGSMSDEQLEQQNEQVIQIFAELCSGSPSAEQLAALPHRVRQAFIGWLSEKLANPPKLHPATRPSAAVPNGASSST
jgi:hypothetical protein